MRIKPFAAALTSLSKLIRLIAVTQADSTITDTVGNLDVSAGKVHIAKTAHANFHRMIGVLEKLESYWHGVRYIRSALMQKAAGGSQIDLLSGPQQSQAKVPHELSAMWENAQGETRNDGKRFHESETASDPKSSVWD